MIDLRTAAQQALEALEGGADSWQLVGPAIDALKAALAEPVLNPAPGYCKHCKQYTIECTLPHPQRKPLTDEEIKRLVSNDMVQFARAIERAHGIV